jgi:alanine racemase
MIKIKDDFFNAFRPGLAMYGYNPLEQSDEKFNQ